MNVRITGRNVDLTEGLKAKIENKMEKLEKFFSSDVEAHVTLKVEKLEQIIEITIPIRSTILRTEVKDRDMYVAIDKGISILEKQLGKYKGKLKNRHKDDNVFKSDYMSEESSVLEEDLVISKVKNFELKPMSDEEAIMQMNLLEHDFYLYFDIKTGGFKVVYRKKDGTYGLIIAH